MLDDLIVGRPSAPELQGTLYIVVNASTKDGDYQLIGKEAGYRATIERLDDNALLALQGPEAAAVLEGVLPGVGELSFMTFRRFTLDGEQFLVSRSGYTGEDGFEILAPAAMARAFWDRLLSDERVRPIGLGARDSLRLEAGLPLYGHDADETVSPVEAGLNFAIAKRRREARDFPGADRILRELGGTLARVRVGLRVLEGAPAREGAEIADETGAVVGRVTSGGPSPTLGGAVAMGFVPPALSAVGTRLKVLVRGRPQAAEVVPTPFTPHRYHRKTAAAS
jgi:aminomethyltransferase